MAKQKVKNLVIEAHGINFTRAFAPKAKYETDGKEPTEREWCTTLLIDEATVDKIKSTYPNLRKKMVPITPKQYLAKFKVAMPKGVEEPHILQLTKDAAYSFEDRTTGEEKVVMNEGPKVFLVDPETNKARNITNEEYVGNGSKGRVILEHRISKYKDKPIDVITMGDIALSELVEVDEKPNQGGNKVDAAQEFGFEIDDEDGESPQGFDNDPDDDSIPFDDEDGDEYE
jgi:hypothetical protein